MTVHRARSSQCSAWFSLNQPLAVLYTTTHFFFSYEILKCLLCDHKFFSLPYTLLFLLSKCSTLPYLKLLYLAVFDYFFLSALEH